MLNKVILIFLIMLNFSLVRAEAVIKQQVGLREFIDLAKQNDPAFKRLFHNEKQMEFFLDQNLPYEPVILSFINEYGLYSSDGINTKDFIGEISKEFVNTGTSVSFGYTSSDQSYKEESVSEVTIEQSLYQNLFGQAGRLESDTVREKQEVVSMEIVESYEDYISTIIIQYLDFQSSYLDKKMAEDIYQEALKLRNDVLARQKKNIATDVDLDRAELQLLLKKEDVVDKNKDFMSKWLVIQEITGYNNLVVPSVNILPLRDKVLPDVSIDNLRLYKISNLNAGIAAKEVKLTDYDNRPDINFYSGYRKDDSSRYGSATKSEELVVGLNVEIPFYDRVGKADKKAANFNYTSLRLDSQVVASELKRKINDIEKQLVELRAKEKLSSDKVRIMERILIDDEKKYQYGKIDLDRLIETRNDLAEYKFSHQTDELNINTKIVELLSLTDQLY